MRQLYSQSLIGNPMLPKTEDEQSWLYQHFESLQKIAAAVPDDARLQVRVAMMMANFGQFDEALLRLRSMLRSTRTSLKHGVLWAEFNSIWDSSTRQRPPANRHWPKQLERTDVLRRMCD